MSSQNISQLGRSRDETTDPLPGLMFRVSRVGASISRSPFHRIEKLEPPHWPSLVTIAVRGGGGGGGGESLRTSEDEIEGHDGKRRRSQRAVVQEAHRVKAGKGRQGGRKGEEVAVGRRRRTLRAAAREVVERAAGAACLGTTTRSQPSLLFSSRSQSESIMANLGGASRLPSAIDAARSVRWMAHQVETCFFYLGCRSSRPACVCRPYLTSPPLPAPVVPVKLLQESLGHVITVELKTGQTYRGKLADGACQSFTHGVAHA